MQDFDKGENTNFVYKFPEAWYKVHMKYSQMSNCHIILVSIISIIPIAVHQQIHFKQFPRTKQISQVLRVNMYQKITMSLHLKLKCLSVLNDMKEITVQ